MTRSRERQPQPWMCQVREYKYYEFEAIDRPLGDRERRELRRLSTRARITPTSFVNDYQWGDFRDSPRRLMETYFDAFLHFTNGGTHQLMLRLPERLVDLATARRYCIGAAATAWTHGDHVIVDLRSENDASWEWADWADDGRRRMASISRVRTELLSGDLRALYLSWLLCVQSGEVDDDAVEPRIPSGLQNLTSGLASFADFLRIDVDLVAAAATASDEPIEYSASDVSSWAEGLPAGEKDALIAALLRGDAHQRAALLKRYREQRTQSDVAESSGRTAGELLGAAAIRREKRERVVAERRAQQRATRERQAIANREKNLAELVLREDELWHQVSNLVDSSKPSNYNAAVKILLDLRTMCGRTGRMELFEQRSRQLRLHYARKRGLLARLDNAGL